MLIDVFDWLRLTPFGGRWGAGGATGVRFGALVANCGLDGTGDGDTAEAAARRGAALGLKVSVVNHSIPQYDS